MLQRFSATLIFAPILLTLLISMQCNKGQSYPFEARIANISGAAIYPVEQSGPSSPLANLEYNQLVRVVGEKDSFYIVEYSKLKGLILKRYMKPGKEPVVSIRYTNALEGVTLLDSPGGRVLFELPHQERTTVIGGKTLDITKPSMSYLEPWVQIQTNDKKTGWVLEEQLSITPVQYYFASIARSGLNLRVEPSLAAPIETLIPFKKIGKALRRQQNVFTVEHQTGSWMEVEIDGKKGWVFSGFVVIGNTPDPLENFGLRTLEYFQHLYEKPEILKPRANAADLLREFQKPTAKETTVIGNYELSIRKRPPPPDDCSSDPITDLTIVKKGTPLTYRINPYDGVSIQPGPLDRSVYEVESHCRCCCPDTTRRILFLLDEQIIAYPFQPGFEEGGGSCSFGPVYIIEFGREYRRSPDGRTLYMDLRYPSCALTEPGKDPSGSEGSHSTTFVSELFIKMHFEDWKSAAQVTRIFDKGIPEEYRGEWENAIPLYRNRQPGAK